MRERKSSTITTTTTSSNKPLIINNDDLLERKIILATEGFRPKFCEITLRNRDKLSEQNALTVCEYIIAMKREINPRLTYIRNTIQFLSELSKCIQKVFEDMTKEDILSYLDKTRKLENEDPLHKWIGSFTYLLHY